ncbi:uncharacterized protein I303_105035 [Kwoniella dejecticola CBS 10117]|uniref:CAMK/CAMKL protein kinase n=1 Tax=Kwoniella dejecticola CBS 10117 TaxID=1296121 RepID=A0A1A6A3M5_9TREE|nr:CAMK/CAMKL protein kinase [Kwoniella dejecticola CBS 10117]OBR84660.1 CAMK/CAMKL protein kinase [Kwoniella dejecticola CBS 10117]
MAKDDIINPGAGTLYVYGGGRTSSPVGRNRKGRSKGSKERFGKNEADTPEVVYTKWAELVKHTEDPTTASNPDSSLKHGITEYTYLPASSGGVLGKGKFSTVYKVLGADGIYYALKHTPLFPHHPLISARLLREPTLLAELPSHPCLIGVEGWVRTEGHFYLVEQYASSHVPLPAHPLPLKPSRAAYILDQLVSVIRDTLHEKGRVCHRDLKGDNVLVDVETGEILILDLGLATRFSASEPKLTTCCGSPAFHSPEIVNALSRPPGEVTYFGPELDIWCIALTLLSLLLQVKFPLGPKHTSPYVMGQRVRDRLQELDEMYPPHAPWRPPSSRSSESSDVDLNFEKREWSRVRKAMRDFLEIDGRVRMHKFGLYEIGEKITQRVANWDEKEQSRRFKSTSFIESEIKYTLPIYLEEDQDANSKEKGKRKLETLVLRNPMGESERRCKSYIKYLLRSAGILYHLLPNPDIPSTISTPTTLTGVSTQKEDTIFQLVLQIPKDMQPDPSTTPMSDPQIGWFPSLFSFSKKPPPITSSPASPPQRSTSLPPAKRSETPTVATVPSAARDKSPRRALRCYIRLEFVHDVQISPINEKRRGSATELASRREGKGNILSPLQPVTSINGTASTASPNYAFPPRSASASRPASVKPLTRRSASQAAVPQTRQPLARVTSTSSYYNSNGAPLSPLSKQISLSESPPETNGTAEPLSRAVSRASSRSRQSSMGYNFPSVQHQQHHVHNHTHTQHSHVYLHESKIIIHLSDPRSYSTLKKAFDVKPTTHSTPTASDLNLLSPMTVRRPSLAPSLTKSVPDPESSEDEQRTRLAGYKTNSSPREEESPGAEEQRGRRRSKEGSSMSTSSASSILQVQKVRSRNSVHSVNVNVKHLPYISGDTGEQLALGMNMNMNLNTVQHVEVPEHGNGNEDGITQEQKLKDGSRENKKEAKKRDRSTKRKSNRSLLDVIFGNSNDTSEGLGTTLGTGYGRAMRARSVPPYRGIEDLQ